MTLTFEIGSQVLRAILSQDGEQFCQDILKGTLLRISKSCLLVHEKMEYRKLFLSSIFHIFHAKGKCSKNKAHIMLHLNNMVSVKVILVFEMFY